MVTAHCECCGSFRVNVTVSERCDCFGEMSVHIDNCRIEVELI